MNNLPDLKLIFDTELPRFSGIADWEDIPILGRSNIENILQIAVNVQNSHMVRGDARAEIQDLTTAIQWLREILTSMSENKPLLPRLRIESFRVGYEVAVYLGDTPGSLSEGWILAQVKEIRKDNKPEWRGHTTQGYYWRITADLEGAVFPGVNTVAFSTSEPRVLERGDLSLLRSARDNDRRYFEVFCENARREWQPIWCLEHGLKTPGIKSDPREWFASPGP